MFFALIYGNQAFYTQQLHDHYGDVVRMAPNELSYANGEAWKDIHGHAVAGKTLKFTKEPGFYHQNPERAPSVINADDASHARMRRIFAHAFSDQALKKQEPTFRRYVDKLIARLHHTVSNNPHYHFDILKMYNFTTFDVMGDLTFGEPLGLLEGVDYNPWISAIFGGIKFGTFNRAVRSFPWIHSFSKLLHPKALNKKRQEHFRFSEDRVDRRLEKDDAKPDIWGLVLQQPEGKGMSKREMYSNSGLFMVAGTETTATLLSGLTFYLLRNPEKLRKLNKEIRDAFDSPEDMSLVRLGQLEYLAACIEEGLRMYPPVPIGLPRVTPPEGAMVAGQWVPSKVRHDGMSNGTVANTATRPPSTCLITLYTAVQRTFAILGLSSPSAGWAMSGSPKMKSRPSNPSHSGRGTVSARSKRAGIHSYPSPPSLPSSAGKLSTRLAD